MKHLAWLVILCLGTSVLGRAQAQSTPQSSADPVSTALRGVLDSYAKNLVATAEEVPEDKYIYHPTPAQMTIGQTMQHVAQVNNFACAKVADTPTPQQEKVSETDKDKLIAELKASMDFCKQEFAKLTDAKLGEAVSMFGGRPGTRFAAALEVTNDLIDHYAALAVYLRLNGMLPPTAQPKK